MIMEVSVTEVNVHEPPFAAYDPYLTLLKSPRSLIPLGIRQ